MILSFNLSQEVLSCFSNIRVFPEPDAFQACAHKRKHMTGVTSRLRIALVISFMLIASATGMLMVASANGAACTGQLPDAQQLQDAALPSHLRCSLDIETSASASCKLCLWSRSKARKVEVGSKVVKANRCCDNRQQINCAMSSPVLTSDERLARLAEGVKMRGVPCLANPPACVALGFARCSHVCRAGSSLPDGWICEVVPRFSKGWDVFFYSPDGVRFRSTLEVYRHLGLDVCVAADKTEAQKRKTQTANHELVGACPFLQNGLDAAQE